MSAPLLWRGEAALVQAALGDTVQAHRLAGGQLELARAFGLPRTLGISLRACGLVEGGESGLELLCEAVKTLERSQPPLELARALSDYGAALRRAGRRIQARAELERSLDLAYHLGARRIAAGARAELIAAGAKPRRDAVTGRDALTAGELRVARLAAEGLTNREIAQALFITTKTAKGHLSHVYRKPRSPAAANSPARSPACSATAARTRTPPRRFPQRFRKTSRAIRQDPSGRCATHPAGRDSLGDALSRLRAVANHHKPIGGRHDH